MELLSCNLFDNLRELILRGTNMQQIIGGILIAFGVADFGLSWMGINLTPFLPSEIARFSPIAFMLVGGAIMVRVAIPKAMHTMLNVLRKVESN